jgi:hypothetical protein
MNAKQFNKETLVGEPVILTDDFGVEHEVNTRSPAWDLCGTAVVSVTGRSGGYDLDRIRKVLEV